MLNKQPVVGMDVTFQNDYIELGSGQEISGDAVGTISNVYSDYVIVKFEDVVSDKGGHLYNDYVIVMMDYIMDTLNDFEWIEQD